jgi:hypothetical protein
MTTDGGEHWSAVAYLGGAMRSLEVIDHQVLAVTACHGPNGLTGGTLSCRTRGGGPWIRITALADNSGAGGIATRAGMAAVVDGSSVLVICDGGLTLTKHATRAARSAARSRWSLRSRRRLRTGWLCCAPARAIPAIRIRPST